MRYDSPCLKKDWQYAFLMNDSYEHIVIDSLEMTAKNIWEYEGKREELLEKLVDHFYDEGFKPFIETDDKSFEKSFIKLINIDPTTVLSKDGAIKNTSRLCLDICRDFCQKSFYATKTNGTPSIYDVYKDKDLLRKVLKNRMGWYTTTEALKLEDGILHTGEHPYLFDISHKMLVQGCHSSMVSANVSNFRPIVAKFLMSKFCPSNGKVLDLSMGWGARLLAALSLGLDYYGIDPMTSFELNTIFETVRNNKKAMSELHKLKSNYDIKLIDGVSEDWSSYESFPDNIDYAIVCPPYFKLEEYACKGNSTDTYATYDAWLKNYWQKTVENVAKKIKPNGKFTLIMIEKWGKYSLLADMAKIIEDADFKLIDIMSYQTTRSHLTDKRESRNTSKNTEKVYTFEARASK